MPTLQNSPIDECGLPGFEYEEAANPLGAVHGRAAADPCGASRYGVRGVAGFDSGSPVLPTMTTEMTAGSVALAFADML
jgi:hypothetical protein